MTQEAKSTTTTVSKYQIGLDEDAMNLIIKGLGKLPIEECANLYNSIVNYKQSIDSLKIEQEPKSTPQEKNGTNTQSNQEQSN